MRIGRTFIIATAAIVAAGLGFYAGSRWPAHQGWRPQAGTMLSKPRPIGEFALIGDDGKPFTQARLEGRWSLVFAGYTHCPDVCPNTLSFLKGLDATLGAENKSVQVVFVSVDPERDTPQRLADYVHYFSPQFVGATAASGALEGFAAKLGIVYAKVPGATPGSYAMDHSAALVLVNPRAEIAGYFLPPLKLNAIAADIGAAMGETERFARTARGSAERPAKNGRAGGS